MKTYAESQNEFPFDWNEALSNPPVQYSTDHIILTELADEWVTCACGNQCDIIPRYLNGSPLDLSLHLLGIKFSNCVGSADWDLAKSTLLKIEQRSTTLINELTK